MVNYRINRGVRQNLGGGCHAAELSLHKLAVAFGSSIEGAYFWLAQRLVWLAVLCLEYTVRADIIACRTDVVRTVLVIPFFVPHPGVLVEAKEFASYACRDRPKDLATDFSFLADDVAICFVPLFFLALRRYSRDYLGKQCHYC